MLHGDNIRLLDQSHDAPSTTSRCVLNVNTVPGNSLFYCGDYGIKNMYEIRLLLKSKLVH